MFYVKNVPGWERALRIVMVVALFAAAMAYFGSTTMGWVVGRGRDGADDRTRGLLRCLRACWS
jgi:hypothetical protein